MQYSLLPESRPINVSLTCSQFRMGWDRGAHSPLSYMYWWWNSSPLPFTITQISLEVLHLKMAIFADYLLYVTNPTISILSLLHEFKRVVALCNFRASILSKFSLNISLLPATVTPLQSSFPFCWKSQALKCLGTYIPRDLCQLDSIIMAHVLGQSCNFWNCTINRPSRGWVEWLLLKWSSCQSYCIYSIPFLSPHPRYSGFSYVKRSGRWIRRTNFLRFQPKFFPNLNLWVALHSLILKNTMLPQPSHASWIGSITGIPKCGSPLIKGYLRHNNLPCFGSTPTSVPLRQISLLWYCPHWKSETPFMEPKNLSTMPGLMTPLFSNPTFSPALLACHFFKQQNGRNQAKSDINRWLWQISPHMRLSRAPEDWNNSSFWVTWGPFTSYPSLPDRLHPFKVNDNKPTSTTSMIWLPLNMHLVTHPYFTRLWDQELGC